MSTKKLYKCEHKKLSKELNDKPLKDYLYCPDCGSISLYINNKYNFIIKPKNFFMKTETDPVQIIKIMRQRQENNEPFLSSYKDNNKQSTDEEEKNTPKKSKTTKRINNNLNNNI